MATPNVHQPHSCEFWPPSSRPRWAIYTFLAPLVLRLRDCIPIHTIFVKKHRDQRNLASWAEGWFMWITPPSHLSLSIKVRLTPFTFRYQLSSSIKASFSVHFEKNKLFRGGMGWPQPSGGASAQFTWYIRSRPTVLISFAHYVKTRSSGPLLKLVGDSFLLSMISLLSLILSVYVTRP